MNQNVRDPESPSSRRSCDATLELDLTHLVGLLLGQLYSLNL